MKLHLELEGDVGEVVRVLRRIGGGDNEDGEVRDDPRPAPTEERTSAVDTVPEPGTTATSATLVPGHWTEELAADFMAGLDIVAGQKSRHVWRASAAGIPRNTLCQRTDLSPAELRSLLMRMGHVLRRFQRERGMALPRPAAATSPEVRETPTSESHEYFPAKLPRLWRQGEVRPTHAAKVRGPWHWRTRKDPFEGVWGDVLVWLQAEPDATGKALMARLQSEHPDRFTEAQLRTMQRRVKEWRGIMAKKLVYAGSDEASAVPSGLPEMTLVGGDPR